LIVGIGLQRIAVRPLQRLAKVIREIGKSGDLGRRTGVHTNDEFGDLSRTFDAMIDDLRSAREQLLEQSYYSGKSELAATSLHNVRNALSPFSTGIWQIEKMLEASFATANVERAAAELADTRVDDGRKAKLAAFLAEAARQFAAERRNLATSLRGLSQQIGSLDQVLTETHAPHAAKTQLESVNLERLFDDIVLPAIRAKHPALQITRTPDMPAVRAERIVLGQILNALVANAADSIVAAGDSTGRIEIAAAETLTAGQTMIRISIADTGEGFSDDVREKMFQRGFSTRKSKGGGLGLHWCANSIAAFGGHVAAESAGRGRGATFHLLLPPAAGKTDRDAA
jgi:signal transduction histidine kinase